MIAHFKAVSYKTKKVPENRNLFKSDSYYFLETASLTPTAANAAINTPIKPKR